VLIQGFYKRTDISAEHPIIDDVVGGFLGLIEGVMLLIMAVIIFSSYTLPSPKSGDVSQLRDAQNAIHDSHIAGGLNDTVVPPFVHVLSGLLPSDLVSNYP
jgi:hypothetical protein